MRPIRFTVIGVTFYLFLYTLAPVLSPAYILMFILFLVGNTLLLYMIYIVLKHGKAPKEKWNDGYWYSDINKKYSENA